MNAEEKQQLARSWIELYKVPEESQRHNELVWSYSQLDYLVRHSPEAAWEVILAILHADQSDATVRNLSAGPLEDLLAKHGAAFIERVERLAADDAEFRFLLSGVWRNAMTEDLWKRVQNACNKE